MSKKLEEYFKNAVVVPGEEAAREGFTEPERAFLEKYLGVEYEAALEAKGLSRPARVETVSSPGAGAQAPGVAASDHMPDMGETARFEAGLRDAQELQLVGFSVAGQDFAVPIELVQEVLRGAAPTKIPAAPPYLAGIMNLRGRVTPLVNLGTILDIGCDACDQGRFVIVCRAAGMRLGLMVEAMAAMHRASPDRVEWGIEAQVGVGAQYLIGLLRHDDRLIKIISIDSLFQKVLKS
ncbi:purine-binding chemotaxis protein CheW [Desulfovibrio sulfodismutans]|uniref:Purine-binding chemotaxis protein CheW n=1 Tax=Desulfolutivibrio sulfodismutans TaxID=63561 RepID=A0A7K3NP39_9BACT|nr:chemotaxis protein CheW [Desulfolutivibrio sulfodismutans]NDY57603.1 purine-binding chemotaxis protein CheW [Desulfolutivibrio sulfodismutans]QLA14082.1 chemotaxis protein CheW [Desulfolutivibrio sulfodismutans DSM 3696]